MSLEGRPVSCQLCLLMESLVSSLLSVQAFPSSLCSDLQVELGELRVHVVVVIVV